MSLAQLKPAADEASVAVIRTLLLTDLVDSTKLVEKLGDARAYEVATRHDRVARDLLPRWGGLEIDKTDGFLLLFERPFDAVGYALAYHRALAELSVELGVQLRSRAGIHLGEVFLRENDPDDVARGAKPLEVEGLAKPTAARAMSLAGGKQTLLTQSAFDLAREAAVDDDAFGGKLRWLAHGPYLFKGVDEPVEIFEVGVEGAAPLAPPADTLKVRRAVAAGDEVTLGWRPGPGLEIPRRPGWLLDKRIGEGGFGEVWLANQQTTGEPRVFKFCYDAQRLRALQREVTLFRLLKESLGDREEILRIHDWNFDEAPYYLEAEYVAGGNLVEWVEERGGLSEIPLPDRLEIVAQVADALAAAHSVGVLHKDVKPANVLITEYRDGRPRAKLTDFGIGEVVDQSELLAKGITVLGMTEIVAPTDSPSSVTGSHLYMAPEVSEGKPATVQADVYALGVLLYQIVAGDFGRALATGWRRDVNDDLLADDITGFVDGSPGNRPASAREVAERLRTLETRRAERDAERLERENAEAARVALERAQRRRKVVTAVATAAVVVLAVVSVLAVQALRARDEAVAARSEADSRRGQAEDLISYMLGDLHGKLEPLGKLEIMDEVGDKAVAYFQALPEERLSDEELFRRSQAMYQIGEVRRKRGKLGEAQTAFEESLALAQSLANRDPSNQDWQKGLGDSHFYVGNVLRLQGDLEGTSKHWRAYLETARRLVEADPENAEWRLELASGHHNLAFVEEKKGNLEGALARYRAGLEIFEMLVTSDSTNTTWRRYLSSGHNHIAHVLKSLGDLDGALENYRAELKIKEALLRKNPSHTGWQKELATSHNFLGRLLQAKGDLDGALGHFRTAEETTEVLTALDPTNTEWQRNLAVANLKVAEILRVRGQLQEALLEERQAVAAIEHLLEIDATNTTWRRDFANAQTRLGTTLLTLSNPEDAEQRGRTALEAVNSLIQADASDRRSRHLLGNAHLLIGRAAAMREDVVAATSNWRLAAETLEVLAETSPNDWELLLPWTEALIHLGENEKAKTMLMRLVKIGVRDLAILDLARKKGILRS